MYFICTGWRCCYGWWSCWLYCGEPCTIAWPILRDFADTYIKCPDVITKYGIRLLDNPLELDPSIISGEIGTVTAGIVALIAENKSYQLRIC